MKAFRSRDKLRGLLLGAAAATVPGERPVVVFDPGPTGAGAPSDGATTSLTSRIRVEVPDPAGGPAEPRIAAARRHLTANGWSVIRSATTADADLVAVRDGYTVHVQRRADDHRLTFLGETPIS